MPPDKTQAELQKFKLAVENASDHIIITDENAVIVYANKAAEKVTGFSRSEIIGQKAGTKSLWGGLMPKEFYVKMWETLKTKKRAFTGELQNRRKNGEIYTALASISPIMDEKGNVRFFVGIERDITKEKEVDRAKTEFVSMASHQLRTPLTTINWYIEMLLSGDVGKVTPEQARYLQEVYNGSQRMVRLVNDLLNVSRLETGKLLVEPVPTDLEKFVESAVAESSLAGRESGVKVVFKPLAGSLGKIPLDPELLQQVLRNLIGNAQRYTPSNKDGVVAVTIDKSRDGEIVISIKDNGIGIPKEDQPLIFERFYRASNAQELAAGGTGLGLYISKLIVESWGGKIWFESQEGGGTTFYVTIPSKGMKRQMGEKKLA